MLIIKELSAHTAGYNQDIQAVSTIESIIQLQDAWSYQALIDLLIQDSIKLIIVTNAINYIVGYCLYQVVFEQAEILRIGTHPQYQRQGIASQLFTALNKELRHNKVESLLLEVRADNAPAIALYAQQGFTVIHRRKGYYQQPYQLSRDALIMQRSYSE
ncbi:ribosomal protein S18-alanine N-acetyltransferase [Psychrobacter sp. CAL346-MNA-CIBAN-0220]|uniref:ribosomal protein S18-alanine N-acetyltransferase n=1 Tax=Psychrobacter sp. CAL346-MNA-CIBAN-0220 TaxID=3140457 RepID=UPI00332BCE5B